MIFEQDSPIERFGQKAGYIFSYLIFTTTLYFLLRFLNKLPDIWTYFHIIGLTFCIVLAGEIIKRLLK